MCRARFSRSLLLVAAGFAGIVPAASPQGEAAFPRPDTSLPIQVDASWSEFDRRNDRLMFRDLHIRQGTLEIRAERATAQPADFTNSVWLFTGSVSISNTGTRATSESARMTFRDNELRTAVLEGGPAQFTQQRQDEPPVQGRAEHMAYDFDAGTIRMTGGASLADGTNQVAGTEIAYDFQREIITAGAGDSGQVHMTIRPAPDRQP